MSFIDIYQTWYVFPSPSYIGENITLCLTIENRGNESFLNGIFEFNDNGYFQSIKKIIPNLKPGQSLSLSVPLSCWGNRSVLDVKENLNYIIKGDNYYKHNMISFTFSQFTKKLLTYKVYHGEKLRILIIGQQGSTKSSFINGCISTLRGKREKEHAIVGAGGGATTLRWANFRPRETNFYFVDTVGITMVNNDITLIKKHIMGIGNKNDEFSSGGKADVVLFFVTCETLKAGQRDWIDMFITWNRTCNECEIPFIFVITRVDILSPKLKNDPNLILKNKNSEEYKKLEELKIDINSIIKISDDRLEYIINYHDNDETENNNFEIDRRNYMVLNKALNYASNTNNKKINENDRDYDI